VPIGHPPPRFGDMRLGRYPIDHPTRPAPAPPITVAPGKPAPVPKAARRDIPFPEGHDLGPVGRLVEDWYCHYNGGTLRRAARAWAALHLRGGRMFLAMAGAFSTAEGGKYLATLIRNGFISGLSVTGANLEEDLFRLVGHQEYREIPNYQDLTAKDDAALADAELPRVTDSTIPEKAAMAVIEKPVDKIWRKAEKDGRRLFPHEPLFELLRTGALADHYQKDTDESWLYAAAMRKDFPLVVPGWGDSTLGQVYTAGLYTGEYSPLVIKSDLEYNAEILMPWYVKTAKDAGIPVGFVQLGGGIAGDFSICAVPCLKADAHIEVPFWSYFCQITDAAESCGGYSGAMPQEKITWLKIEPDTPSFAIFGDYTTIFPLIAAYVLGR
jgi:deoxyhypusine synthase